MQAFFAFLNEPLVLWGLLISGVGLVLIDYFFPVDWPAFGGYFAISVFCGATAPLGPLASLVVMPIAFVGLIVLHIFVLSQFLTNAPKYEEPGEETAPLSQETKESAAGESAAGESAAGESAAGESVS